MAGYREEAGFSGFWCADCLSLAELSVACSSAQGALSISSLIYALHCPRGPDISWTSCLTAAGTPCNYRFHPSRFISRRCWLAMREMKRGGTRPSHSQPILQTASSTITEHCHQWTLPCLSWSYLKPKHETHPKRKPSDRMKTMQFPESGLTYNLISALRYRHIKQHSVKIPE